MRKYLFLALLPWLLGGCMTAPEHRAAVEGDAERITVGKVQREIRVGMSGAEVVKVLGTPNIVSTDEERREVWVYDRVSTTTAYSESRAGVLALILAGEAGGALGGAGGSAGARSTSQRTLTVIIKFDKEARVRDFAYHASQF
jgi:outer membrane protein assembly factor BamE (lipoprotein component of BamABCDE complex)